MSKMKELTRCPRCNKILVSHEEIHAIKGDLYCSKNCAVLSIMDDYILNAKELALEDYDSMAEIVGSADVLQEDLQTVEIKVVCTKRINLPANLTKEEACHEARRLHDEGLVVVEPDDCEEIEVLYTLVEEENSVSGSAYELDNVII